MLDRWLVSETHRLVRDTDEAYAAFDTQRLGLLINSFVDVLSNWYVRRSRRRFWSGDAGALATLHETLDVLTRVMAPLMPFVTERVWQDVFRPVTPGLPESVHLAAFPTYDETLIDDVLAQHVSMAKRVVELGRSARAEAKVRTRQPLSRALVGSAAIADLSPELLREIADELNVGSVEPLSSAGADLVEFSAKGNFRELGKRFAQADPGGRRRDRRGRRRRPGRLASRSRVRRRSWSTARTSRSARPTYCCRSGRRKAGRW